MRHLVQITLSINWKFESLCQVTVYKLEPYSSRSDQSVNSSIIEFLLYRFDMVPTVTGSLLLIQFWIWKKSLWHSVVPYWIYIMSKRYITTFKIEWKKWIIAIVGEIPSITFDRDKFQGQTFKNVSILYAHAILYVHALFVCTWTFVCTCTDMRKNAYTHGKYCVRIEFYCIFQFYKVLYQRNYQWAETQSLVKIHFLQRMCDFLVRLRASARKKNKWNKGE